LSYLVLYPDLEDPSGRFARFLRTAFHNVGQGDSFELVPVSLVNEEEQRATFNWVKKFAWGTTGTLVLFEDVWQLYLEHVVQDFDSEFSGYRHLVYINSMKYPLFVLKVDDFKMGFKEICEYVKWLILEAGYFEVQRTSGASK
jgi:hypothetical protein